MPSNTQLLTHTVRDYRSINQALARLQSYQLYYRAINQRFAGDTASDQKVKMTFVYRRFEEERHTDCFSGLWKFWKRIFAWKRTEEEAKLIFQVREEVTMVDIVKMAEEEVVDVREEVDLVVDVKSEEEDLVVDVKTEEEDLVVDVKAEDENLVVDVKTEEEAVVVDIMEDQEEDNEGEWTVVEKRRRQKKSPVSRPANPTQARRYRRHLYKPPKFFRVEPSVAVPQPEIIDRQEDHKATNKHQRKTQKAQTKTHKKTQQQTQDKRSKQKRNEHNRKVVEHQRRHKKNTDDQNKTEKKQKKSKKNKQHKGKPVKKVRKTKAEKMAKLDKIAKTEKKQRQQGRRLAKKHHKR